MLYRPGNVNCGRVGASQMPKTVRSGPGLLQQPLGGHTGNVTQTLPRFYHPFDHFFYSRRIRKIVSRQDDLDARIRDFCKRIEIACADFTTRWREIEARVGPRAMAELRDIANHSLLVAVAATVASLPQTDQDRFLQTLENNADAVPRAWHRSAPLPMDLDDGTGEVERSGDRAVCKSCYRIHSLLSIDTICAYRPPSPCSGASGAASAPCPAPPSATASRCRRGAGCAGPRTR